MGCFFGHDGVQRAVQQVRIDRLPVAFPVGKRALFHLRILEITLVDLLFSLGHLVAVIVSMVVAMGCGFVATGSHCRGRRQQHGTKCDSAGDAGEYLLHCFGPLISIKVSYVITLRNDL
ncbi:hypothetical protein D3C86_1385280 [compost metagenome]